MKNYRVSQTFYLTGYVELPYKTESVNISEYNFLVQSLKNLILNGGNLEEGDKISIKHKENNCTIYSDIRIDKISYTINESGVIYGIDLRVYGKSL